MATYNLSGAGARNNREAISMYVCNLSRFRNAVIKAHARDIYITRPVVYATSTRFARDSTSFGLLNHIETSKNSV